MYDKVRTFLFQLDAERAHRLTLAAARASQRLGNPTVADQFGFEHAVLEQSLLGLTFPNPVGLAAGFDKNAELESFWTALGFGFAEVGSVTARASRGNPRPRAFRLEDDEAIINRMGLNNQGADRVARRLRGRAGERERPLGINIAKTHDARIVGEAGIEDFRTSFRALAPLAEYVTINISCPNTAEGKTFEEPDLFHPLLKALFAERRALNLEVPVLVKLAPPYTEKLAFDSRVEELLAIATVHGVHGYVATNTASDRDGLDTPDQRLALIGSGGLSGAPIEARSTALVRYLYHRTHGQVPIIGVGGVRSALSAYRKIRAGASLVQLYTGLVYEGPGLLRAIKEGLVSLLERDGFSNVAEAVGVDA